MTVVLLAAFNPPLVGQSTATMAHSVGLQPGDTACYIHNIIYTKDNNVIHIVIIHTEIIINLNTISYFFGKNPIVFLQTVDHIHVVHHV
jgi:hypothetical protein